MHAPATDDVGDDLQIAKTTFLGPARAWVIGFIAGHRFDALVFAEHAERPEYELGQSRISKLWLFRPSDDQTVFNWDRGMDIDATDDLTREIVDFLAAGLAEAVFNR